MGPFSASSRGRVGVNVGPVSAYGGGGRGGGGCLGFLVFVIGFVAVMWSLSLWGHAIHLTPSWHQLMHHDDAWLHRHYPKVGLRYLAALAILVAVVAAIVLLIKAALAPGRERAAQLERTMLAQRREELALEHQEWLDGPPPPFHPPGRITQTWLEDNVPDMHPGQIPMLVTEMKARGWNEDRIAQRVEHLIPEAHRPPAS
jgi:hypothetical protein